MTNREYTDESLIAALKTIHNETLSDDAKARMRRALEAPAAPVTPPTPTVRRFSLFSFSAMIPALVIVCALALGAGTAVAADRAKPGDRLFGVDRAIEWVRLKLAVSGEAKAQIAAAIADERQHEADLLAQKGREETQREAERQSRVALERAQQTVAEVRAKMQAKENAKAAEALKKVEDKLAGIRARKADDDDDDRGLTEAEVKLFGAYALIKLELNDEKSSYQMETTDRNAILSDIAKRTGLTSDSLKSIVTFEAEDGDEDDDDDRKNGTALPDDDDGQPDENASRSTPGEAGSGSAGNATNGNRNDDDDEDKNENRNTNTSESRWKIEVRVDDGRAEITTEYGKDRQEWTSQSTDRTVLLAEIAARTGLTAADIEAVWDFETED